MKKESKLYNIFTVLVGALLVGAMWRVRGTHGWGSEMGVLNVGFMFAMFAMLIKGNRQKLNLGWFGLTVAAFVATTPAWGTFLTQITGYFEATDTNLPSFETSPVSGVIIMLILGFGISSLYGILLGRGFSSKQWKIQHLIVLLVVFFGVGMLCRTCVSHWVLNAFQPEAGKYFETVAADRGIEGTAYQMYMQHFDNISWAKKQCAAAGRNYFASISTISTAIAGIAAMLTARFFIKDKKAARFGFTSSLAFSIGITVPDLFFYFSRGGFHGEQGYTLPEFMSAWSCWEYFTGFIAGGIMTAALLHLKAEEDVHEPAFDFLPEKIRNIFGFLLGYLALIGLNVARPLISRFDESSTGVIIAVAAAAVIFSLAIVFIAIKKIGLTAEKGGMAGYAKFFFPVLMAFIPVTYFFLGDTDNPAVSEITQFHNICVIISVITVFAWYFISANRYKKANS